MKRLLQSLINYGCPMKNGGLVPLFLSGVLTLSYFGLINLCYSQPRNVYPHAYGGEKTSPFQFLPFEERIQEFRSAPNEQGAAALDTVLPAWISRYNRASDYPIDDSARLIDADASGNTYVTGNTVTVKYDPDGNQLWAVPVSGRQIRCGNEGIFVNNGVSIVKLGADGTHLWSAGVSGWYRADSNLWVSRSLTLSSFVLDDSNNVYVGGTWSWDEDPWDPRSWTYYGWGLAKIATDGSISWEIWKQVAGWPTYQVSVEIDNTYERIFVGSKRGGGCYGTDGTEHYTASYGENLQLDETGFIYTQWYSGNGFNRFDSAGQLLWGRYASGMVNYRVLPSGDVVAVGRSTGIPAARGFWLRKYGSTGDTLWSAHYGMDSLFSIMVRGLDVDHNGDVYVIGAKVDSTTPSDIIIVKYHQNGQFAWDYKYGGEANRDDEPADIHVDRTGVVHVTGKSKGNDRSFDYVTLEVGSSGDPRWVSRYNSPPHQRIRNHIKSMRTDANGNVIAVGSMQGRYYTGYVTVKYDASGNQQWEQYFTLYGTDYAYDYGVAGPQSMQVDFDGNIILTGYLYDEISDAAIVTVKYDPDGNLIWDRVFKGAARTNSYGFDLVLGSDGAVYVAGMSDSTPVLLKYTGQGDTAWIRYHDTQGRAGYYMRNMVIDDSDNVYVHMNNMRRHRSDLRPMLAKYTASGDLSWSVDFADSGSIGTHSHNVILGVQGHVYVVGETYHGGYYTDMFVAKYDATGANLWTQQYGHPDLPEVALYASPDPSGNLYVIGMVWDTLSSYDLSTQRYSPNGDLLWTQFFDREQSWDVPYGMAVDSNSNVCITSTSEGRTTIIYDSLGRKRWQANFEEAYVSDLLATYDNLLCWEPSGDILIGFTGQWLGGQLEMAIVKYSDIVLGLHEKASAVPSAYMLYQNYPNPFNPSTVIRYSLPVNGWVTLKVWNVLGQDVATLVNEKREPGSYAVRFDGSKLPSGVYFYRLDAANAFEPTKAFTQTRKLLLVK